MQVCSVCVGLSLSKKSNNSSFSSSDHLGPSALFLVAGEAGAAAMVVLLPLPLPLPRPLAAGLAWEGRKGGREDGGKDWKDLGR